MNIYDFDNTILKGDSSIKFIKYSLIRHPLLVIKSFLKAFKECVKLLFKKSNLGLIKSELFSFVKNLNDFDNYINNFIIKNQRYVKNFYLEQQSDNDVVISASFDFIIIPFCKSLGIKNIIATKYDVKKGHIIGNNCKGEEKVKRFHELYPKALVKNAYSDSLSDIPMFNLAKNAYLVKDDELILYHH